MLRASLVVLALVSGCFGTAELEGVSNALAQQPEGDAGGVTLEQDGGAVEEDAGSTTSAAADAGAVDAGALDAGAVDAGAPDAGAGGRRTQAQVCEAWTNGYRSSTNTPFTKTTATCDPGVLSRAGIDDTLARLNMFRWLVGLAPVTDDATDNDAAQKCSLVSAWNPAGQQAHSPAPTATCYTAIGAAGAGSSNIAWGSGSPQAAIDQWMIDNGNFSTMGHRRWLLNPPLNPVGIGYYEGGNNYGSASCIRVFSSGGTGPSPSWYAFPPPGFAPVQTTQWVWSVHGNALGNGLDGGVTRASDGAAMPVVLRVMQGGFGQPAITLERTGWNPVVGETYRVQVTSTTRAAIEYEVTPVSCP